MRGEYRCWYPARIRRGELPPRARRILLNASLWGCLIGTTSACAENTAPHHSRGFAQWNYLRVRGEYVQAEYAIDTCSELPPRARRILLDAFPSILKKGTTSACAENTQPAINHATPHRNYLRVRGEYGQLGGMAGANLELPPRARRIQAMSPAALRSEGTTSACAENTNRFLSSALMTWNYLRVRGEYRRLTLNTGNNWELPPRARRIQQLKHDLRTRTGTTSACAENTLNELGLL